MLSSINNITVLNDYLTLRAAKEFGRAFVNANVSMEPQEVSVLWFIWYVKSSGGSKRIWEVENGGQVRKKPIILSGFVFVENIHRKTIVISNLHVMMKILCNSENYQKLYTCMHNRFQ